MRPPEGVRRSVIISGPPSDPPAGRLRRPLARAISREEPVGRGIAERIEEAPAAVGVTPALGVHAAGVVALVEIGRPLLAAHLGRMRGARDVRLAAVDELGLGTLAAIGTLDQQHGSSQ